MPIVTFTLEPGMLKRALAAFEKHRSRITELLPLAEVQHIGSSAVPGTLTKGDLDILVRVTSTEFIHADNALSTLYRRNEDSLRDAAFSSFKDDEAELPLGIQLTVVDSAQDHFTTFRDALLKDAALVESYNQLKRQCEGQDMAEYRKKKNEFIQRVITAARD